LWEFTLQIYNFGAVGDKDELTRFQGQENEEIKVQGHGDATCSRMNTFEAFSHLSLEGNLSATRTYHYQVQMALLKYSRYGFRGQGHRQHFPKMHFLAEVY